MHARAQPAMDGGGTGRGVQGGGTARGILREGGPRFARDGFGPMVAFYVGWRAGGLVPGIGLATSTALGLWWWDRRQGRRGLMLRIGIVLVFIQAAVGLLSGSERLYLAQPVVINGCFALAFLGSAAIGRPLIGTFAAELADMPDEVRASATYRRVFGIASVVWGTYFLLRTVLRLWVLAYGSIEGFLAVNALTGAPIMVGLFAWTTWWCQRAFRRSKEWGPFMVAPEAPAP